jgi:hypothetical protein
LEKRDMSEDTKPKHQRPGSAQNPLTERMIEEMVAAHPELSRKKCIQLLIKPAATKPGLLQS